MGLKDELVVVSDPTETDDAQSSMESPQTDEQSSEPENSSVEEEEEEADTVDPHDTLRESCKPACSKYQEALDTCNERVENTEGTEETCVQELFDFLHCVDSCASKNLFNKIK